MRSSLFCKSAALTVLLESIFLLTCNLVFAADSCSYVRLDEAERSVSYLKVPDQGQIGDCYSEAAVALIDAYRFSHDDHQFDLQSSAEYTAATWKLSIGDKDLDGGFTANELLSAKKSGICTLPSSFSLKSRFKGKSVQAEEVIHSLDLLLAQYRDASTSKADKEALAKGLIWNECPHKQVRIFAATVDYIPPAYMQLLDPNILILAIKQDNETAFVRSLYDQVCSQFMRAAVIPDPTVVKFYEGATWSDRHEGYTKERSAIDTGLNASNPQPTAVSFDSSVLRTGRAFKPSYRSDGLLNINHEAVVIGRRRGSNGQCQYLLRNSWGNQCDKGKEVQGDGTVVSSNWTCYGPNIWIDSDTLMSSVNEEVFLSP